MINLIIPSTCKTELAYTSNLHKRFSFKYNAGCIWHKKWVTHSMTFFVLNKSSVLFPKIVNWLAPSCWCSFKLSSSDITKIFITKMAYLSTGKYRTFKGKLTYLKVLWGQSHQKRPKSKCTGMY